METPETPDAPTGTISVAEALALIADGYTGEATVTGYIYEISELSTSYGNATYIIKDELSDDEEGLTVYRGYWFNGEKFTSENQIEAGKTVTVTGTLVDYNGTPEFTTGSKIVEYDGQTSAPDSPETPDQPETPANVITVAEALALIADGYNSEATVKGLISEVSEISTSYGNATYTIKDALTDENGLIVYRGYWFNGDKFTSADQLEVGKSVTVTGTLVNYNGTTPEFTTGSKIVEYDGKTSTPDTPDTPDQPGDDNNDGTEVTELWSSAKGGFETGTSATAPTEPTTQTSTATGIEYTFFQAVVNSQNYLFIKGGASEGYISWTLEYPISSIELTTSGGNSTADGNTVAIYANDEAITPEEGLAVNAQNQTYTVEIPDEYQIEGVEFKVAAIGTKNTQFTSFKYVKSESSSFVGVVLEENAPVEYFNLQGVRVANPENGLYIRRQGNTVSKVLVK